MSIRSFLVSSTDVPCGCFRCSQPLDPLKCAFVVIKQRRHLVCKTCCFRCKFCNQFKMNSNQMCESPSCRIPCSRLDCKNLVQRTSKDQVTAICNDPDCGIILCCVACNAPVLRNKWWEQECQPLTPCGCLVCTGCECKQKHKRGGIVDWDSLQIIARQFVLENNPLGRRSKDVLDYVRLVLNKHTDEDPDAIVIFFRKLILHARNGVKPNWNKLYALLELFFRPPPCPPDVRPANHVFRLFLTFAIPNALDLYTRAVTRHLPASERYTRAITRHFPREWRCRITSPLQVPNGWPVQSMSLSGLYAQTKTAEDISLLTDSALLCILRSHSTAPEFKELFFRIVLWLKDSDHTLKVQEHADAVVWAWGIPEPDSDAEAVFLWVSQRFSIVRRATTPTAAATGGFAKKRLRRWKK